MYACVKQQEETEENKQAEREISAREETNTSNSKEHKRERERECTEWGLQGGSGEAGVSMRWGDLSPKAHTHTRHT